MAAPESPALCGRSRHYDSVIVGTKLGSIGWTCITRADNARAATNPKGYYPMLRTTLAAAFFAAGLAMPAEAIPASSPAPSISEARQQPINIRNNKNRHWKNRHHWNARRHHWNRRHWHGRSHWRDHRYRGWRRYHSRPWNWRARGCVVVGPVWFCP
jgi:hypothetical protein